MMPEIIVSFKIIYTLKSYFFEVLFQFFSMTIIVRERGGILDIYIRVVPLICFDALKLCPQKTSEKS